MSAPGGGFAAAVARVSLPLLRRLAPETAHDLGLSGLELLRPLSTPVRTPPGLALSCMGLTFAHPLGLAAGFDKNGDHLDALGALGFSHVELGTVTPRPQPGNPKPRMFRAAGGEALVNRMGFNNKGVDHLVDRLERATYRGIRGISIGKNADTPLERAVEDYVFCMRKAYAQADYLAVNVSSPNTARLRELQAAGELHRILDALLESRGRLQAGHSKRVPLLVKIAPDLSAEQLRALAAAIRSAGIDGVIATNTTTDLSSLGSRWPEDRRGGLSGAPLHERSVSVIAQLRAELGSGFPIIGVGGILDQRRALTTLRAGANLLQVYTGFACRGPALIGAVLSELRVPGVAA